MYTQAEALFSHESINVSALKSKAYNFRWAEVEEGVIPMTAADPDFPVASEIVQSIQQYIQDGYFSYTPHTGFPRFKQAMANYVNERKNEGIDPELVLPIDSAARGMYIIAQTVLNSGDEVIVFDPVDYLFRESSLATKGKVVLFPAVVTNDDRIDLSSLESYVTEKTRMICLCNPHNPLGLVYTKEDLAHILAIANKYDLWIMNDEIWSDIVYPEKPFISILSLGKELNRKTLSVFGFSKSYGIASLRSGALYATEPVIFQELVKNSGVLTTAGGITAISQVAAIACLEQCSYWLEAFLKHLQSNRDHAVERLGKMPYVTVRKPQATYLLFINISKTGLSSETFATRLRTEGRLALVPGTARFFGPGSEGYVRMCFATSRTLLDEGLDRLEAFLKSLQ